MLIEGLPKVDSGLVALGIAFVTLIAWATRVESKNAQNARDIEKLEKRQEIHETKLAELDGRVMKELLEIKNMLGNIQGQLTR